MKSTYLLLVAALIVVSCKKKKTEDDFVFDGNINITSIEEGDTIQGGNSFPVVGTVTANTEMHGYVVQLLDEAENVLLEEPAEDHAYNYAINVNFPHAYADTVNQTVRIMCVIDHEGNLLTKDVNFVYVP